MIHGFTVDVERDARENFKDLLVDWSTLAIPNGNYSVDSFSTDEKRKEQRYLPFSSDLFH